MFKKGNYIIATAEKNRFVPEGTKGEMYVSFEKGINPYYRNIILGCN